MDKADSIDFKTITAEVVTEVSRMPLERPGGFFNRRPVKINVTPGMLREMLLREVWGKGIGLLNNQEAKAEPLLAEKALSELMKKAVVRDKIVYKKNSFRLQLGNGQYRVYKTGTAGAVCACPWPSEVQYEVRMSGSRFADYILRFDAEIPEIVSHIPEIIETRRAREFENLREKVEKELKEEVLRSLIEQYLKPLGLSVHYTLGDGDMVSMDVSQTLSAHLEMPLAQMMENLKDPDTLKTLLQVEKQFPYPEDE